MTSDQELKGKVAVALYNADPEGLAVMRCPSDEYDCEAELIMDRLHEVTNTADMSRLVATVFRAQFGHGTTVKGDGTTSHGPVYDEADLDRMYDPESAMFQSLGKELWEIIND